MKISASRSYQFISNDRKRGLLWRKLDLKRFSLEKSSFKNTLRKYQTDYFDQISALISSSAMIGREGSSEGNWTKIKFEKYSFKNTLWKYQTNYSDHLFIFWPDIRRYQYISNDRERKLFFRKLVLQKFSLQKYSLQKYTSVSPNDINCSIGFAVGLWAE